MILEHRDEQYVVFKVLNGIAFVLNEPPNFLWYHLDTDPRYFQARAMNSIPPRRSHALQSRYRDTSYQSINLRGRSVPLPHMFQLPRTRMPTYVSHDALLYVYSIHHDLRGAEAFLRSVSSQLRAGAQGSYCSIADPASRQLDNIWTLHESHPRYACRCMCICR